MYLPKLTSKLAGKLSPHLPLLITCCLILSCLVIFFVVTPFIHFLIGQPRPFRQWCSIPYTSRSLQLSRASFSPDAVLESQALRLSSENRDRVIDNNVIEPAFEKFFDEEFDIDTKDDRYERIEVPDFSDGRKGRFIHDFAVNKTGIVDFQDNRCFVLPLNRSMVYPPHSLMDLVIKLRSGFYDIDTEIVRESYRVVTPAIFDFKSLGYYIARECNDFPVYKLEKVMTSSIVKRDTHEDDSKVLFTEFAGAKINQIKIVNLHTIEKSPHQRKE